MDERRFACGGGGAIGIREKKRMILDCSGRGFTRRKRKGVLERGGYQL